MSTFSSAPSAMAISQEWATRPADQRFTNMHDLHAFNMDKQRASQTIGVALDHMAIEAEGNRVVLGPKSSNQRSSLTHWAFGQLAARVGAPAGYLRELPADIAALNLAWQAEQEQKDASIFLVNGTVNAVTSDTYGRIHDAKLTGAILDYVNLDTWKVPSASYASKDPKRATTLYASDRDCFVALVDDAHPIEVSGTNGNETVFRGFFARNSEVGSAALEITTFLYRYICDNRIIWGGRDFKTLKIRHTSGGPMRYLREAQPTLQAYLTAPASQTVSDIVAARETEVGKTEKDVKAWLVNRGFTKGQATNIYSRAESDEGMASPRSVWGLVQGATDLAHDISYGDERLAFERTAAKMLDVVG